MTEKEVNIIYEKLLEGKIILLSDVDYGYGDRTQTFLRFSKTFNELRYEMYNLHGNDEELVRTEPIAKEQITKLVGNDLEIVSKKLATIELYPWVK